MSELQIVHVPERDRWEAQGSDGEAVGHLSYVLTEGVLDLQHTVVDGSQQGRGVGGRLVEAGIRHALDEGLAVRPTCSYVQRWLQDNPQPDLETRDA